MKLESSWEGGDRDGCWKINLTGFDNSILQHSILFLPMVLILIDVYKFTVFTEAEFEFSDCSRLYWNNHRIFIWWNYCIAFLGCQLEGYLWKKNSAQWHLSEWCKYSAFATLRRETNSISYISNVFYILQLGFVCFEDWEGFW